MAVAVNRERNPIFYLLLMLFLICLVIWAIPGIAGPEESHYPYPFSFQEKLAINRVSFEDNSASLSLTVLGMQGYRSSDCITVTTAFIRDNEGKIVQSVNLESASAKIPVNQSETTLHINLNSTLPSKEHFTVTLVTPVGSSFVSPSFIAS